MVWRTTAITISTCFFLGTTFTHWIADHNVLWRSPLTAEALDQSIVYYSLLASAPTYLGWTYIGVGLIALGSVAGRMLKGYRGSDGEILFDGGSLVLLAGIAYNQINEVYPTITIFPSPVPRNLRDHALYPALSTAVRDLANDNTITAVMLTGVMLLQAGRYYAKRSATIPQSASSPSNSSLSSSAPGSRGLPPRSGTPFRELTEDEAMELREVEKETKRG